MMCLTNQIQQQIQQTQYTQISTFNDVQIKHNTLLICDIDDTVLYFDRSYDKYYKMMKDDHPYFPEEEIQDLAKGMYELSSSVLPALSTDADGFKQMLETIQQTNSKLIFLTARNKTSDKKTKKDLMKSNNINYNMENPFGNKSTDLITEPLAEQLAEPYPIHYTNNQMTKGEYIKANIELTNYDNIIFIDDYPSYIESVKNLFPEIKCYLFKRIIN